MEGSPTLCLSHVLRFCTFTYPALGWMPHASNFPTIFNPNVWLICASTFCKQGKFSSETKSSRRCKNFHSLLFLPNFLSQMLLLLILIIHCRTLHTTIYTSTNGTDLLFTSPVKAEETNSHFHSIHKLCEKTPRKCVSATFTAILLTSHWPSLYRPKLCHYQYKYARG